MTDDSQFTGRPAQRAAQLLLLPFLPAIASARSYDLRKLRGDVIAGLTVAVVAVPQSMAYAYIAGVPPQYGIYSSIIQCFISAIFTSNDHLTCGPTNTQAILTAATVTRLVEPGNPEMYLQLAIGLTLLKGLTQLVFALARVGHLVKYVSQSVIVGFAAGVGVLIGFGQLADFLGLDVTRSAGEYPGVIGIAQRLLPHVTEISFITLGIGVGSMTLILMTRALSKTAPAPLIAVVVASLCVYLFGWTQAQTALVGRLPTFLPSPSLPTLTWSHTEAMLGGAGALALLGMIETIGIGKSIAIHTGARINANREFFAQGMANIVGAFFQNFSGSGSFTRTALNYLAGGKTRYAGVFNACFVALILMLCSDLARFVPLASLAAILLILAYQLIDFKRIIQIARTSKSDATVCLITFASALLMPLAYAIYIGIFLNIALYMCRASKLHMAEVVHASGGPFIERPLKDRHGDQPVVFLQLEGDLFFGIADELQDRFASLLNDVPHVVILRLKRTHHIDTTVMGVFDQFAKRMAMRDRHVILCGLQPELKQKLQSFGLIDVIGPHNIFETGFGVFGSAKLAFKRARDLLGSSFDVAGLDMEDDSDPSYSETPFRVK
jgi:sulfate permease, SulP family